jgi:hypothetical protein
MRMKREERTREAGARGVESRGQSRLWRRPGSKASWQSRERLSFISNYVLKNKIIISVIIKTRNVLEIVGMSIFQNKRTGLT